ncbi:MAG TPA: DUF2163 domain-containing protein [Candidatus Omnitrophota bacterium]|nr:DUF2163 domain-containing protein [Candidatus Omnitrophota bacterium]
MTLNINSTTKTEKNKQENRPIYLYTIFNYDGAGNNLYLAESDADVVFDSVTYTKFPIKHSELSENSSSEIDSLTVSVANISRLIQGYLELYDLRGKKVTVKIVWADQLADTDAYLDFSFYIDNYTATEETVEFQLTSKFDLLDVSLPVGVYYRNYCRWKFKGTECAYAGAETVCDKRKVTCKTVMSNIARYGGFPSIPSQRVYV